MVLRFATRGGATILVGETAAENDRLCAAADKDDVWFHLDGVPSPHVILHGHGLTTEAIADCCQLCKMYSKQKCSTWASVVHVPIHQVRKVRTDATGTVRLLAKPMIQMVATDPSTIERLLTTKQRVRSHQSDRELQQQRPTAFARKRERKSARKTKQRCRRRATCEPKAPT